MVDKCVFTVATGKKYRSFAYTLARSYHYHNDIAIPFFIVSDEDFVLPVDLEWVKKKIISKELIGHGIEYKFSFDEVSPAEFSLFIDADSIIYKDISPLFDMAGSINVIGQKITNETWADLASVQVLSEFKIPYLIKYCGAFYFIGKNKTTAAVCETARQLWRSDYPFQQHRYSVNDEPILSVSMARHNIEPILDTGNLWTDIAQLKTHKDLNVLKGIAQFTNSPGNIIQKPWIPMGSYSPSIVHMGGAIYNKNPWLFDSIRLRLYYKLKLSANISDVIVNVFVKGIYFLSKRLRNLFH